MTPNNEWKKMGASLGVSGSFSLLCLVSLTSMDGMRGGYAIAFISFFLAISGVAVALLFIHRARVMDAILYDPSPLARWIYPEEMVKASAEREYPDFQERNHAMFIVIGGMLAAVALFFIIFVSDGGPETGTFLLGVMALLFVVSRIMPGLERRRAKGAPKEAYISRTGIIYEGAVYPFRSFLMYHTGVSYQDSDKRGPARIVFSFTQLVGRFIIQPFDVPVPVPPGEEDNARDIVRQFLGK